MLPPPASPRPPRSALRPRASALALLAVVAGLLLAVVGMGSASAHAPDRVTVLCVPSAKAGCIAGTVGQRPDTIGGVDVTLTAPDGSTKMVTTEDDGKFTFQISAAGDYLVSLDEATLPDGDTLEKVPDNLAGPNGELKVKGVLGKTTAAILTVRPPGFSTETSKSDDLIVAGVVGLQLGLLLALASVGLSLIYGTTGLSNFAHAEQVTLGGMLGYLFCSKIGMPLPIGIVVVTLVCAASGYLQERILWRPLRRRGLALTQLMIVTIGLSLALQYVFQMLVGAGSVSVEKSASPTSKFGPVVITHIAIAGMIVAVVVLALVGYVLLRTRIGRATRAVSDNPGLAAASGINTDRIIALVWTSAAGLAGLGGVFYALVYSGVKWDTGLQILLLLFAAVTLGGLGTAFGALIGSLVIGLVVEIAPVLGMPGDFKYATPLVILILLLLVRPQGLLGKAQRVG